MMTQADVAVVVDMLGAFLAAASMALGLPRPGRRRRRWS